MIPSGVASATATLVGNFLGANEVEDARTTAKIGAVVDTVYVLLCFVFVLVCIRAFMLCSCVGCVERSHIHIVFASFVADVFHKPVRSC